MKPKVCVLRTDGTNCDRETAYAFNLVGGDAEIVHINSLIKKYDPVQQREIRLEDYHILAVPGGFSYGDYIAAGKILAVDLKHFLGKEIQQFVDSGKPAIGICNGLQVFAKLGLLPGEVMEQKTTLTYNNSQRFECRWVKLVSSNECLWTKGIKNIDLPVAHGEGRFVAPDETIRELLDQGQVVFQYADEDGTPTMKFPENPNGSSYAVAGIRNPSGTVFGLMPHPERYNHPKNHHLSSLQEVLSREYVDRSDYFIARRLKIAGTLPKEGAGLQIFRNGIDYALENLL